MKVYKNHVNTNLPIKESESKLVSALFAIGEHQSLNAGSLRLEIQKTQGKSCINERTGATSTNLIPSDDPDIHPE